MRKIAFMILLSQFIACESNKLCPDIIKGKPENHLISDKDLSSVKSLFSSNNLDLENFQVYIYQQDELGHTFVTCHQYYNNLKVFSDDVVFSFDNLGKYYFLSGELISSIEGNLSITPSMSKEEVVEIYLQSIEGDSFYADKISNIENECILCELGYYDINSYSGGLAHIFKLAWSVTPNDSPVPQAYINDTDKVLISYNNGIYY